MAQPRQRGMVRRLRAGGRPSPRRPGGDVDHAQRAVGRGRRRLPARHAGARPSEPLRAAARDSQPAPRPRRRGRRVSGAGTSSDRPRGQPRAKYPASDRPADVEATTRADAYMNRQYLDPVLLGTYPTELRTIFGAAWPDHAAAELEAISRPIDFLGVNYYTRGVTRADRRHAPLRARTVRSPRQTRTETGWEVYPAGLTDVLRWVRARYGAIPIYVTENGAAFYDPPTAVGDRVEDPLRVAYLRAHVGATLDAIASGVDVRGYFAWSLLDNFEWSHGYSKRFGLVHVDFATQRRTVKASGALYADIARTNGRCLTP